MKNNKVYCCSAIMSALMKFYSIHDIAMKVEDLSDDITGTELEVYTCKSDGFVLRRKKDVIVSDADMTKLFIKSIRELIKETDDAMESYIFDQYDFEFNDKMVDVDFASQIFDIEKNGRLITVELDL